MTLEMVILKIVVSLVLMDSLRHGSVHFIEDLHQANHNCCDEGKEREAIMRLARVGYDNVIGYLAGGMDSWIDCWN